MVEIGGLSVFVAGVHEVRLRSKCLDLSLIFHVASEIEETIPPQFKSHTKTSLGKNFLR